MEINELTLDIQQSVEVKGSAEKVFESVVYRLGEGNLTPDGQSLNLKIEPFAGGRWFRDRGEGVQHLWGHIQVIKAPVLLEMSGPLFMSYPVLNHVEVRLVENGETTTVTLRHRAVGMIDPAHRGQFGEGWQEMLDRIRDDYATASTEG